MVAEIGITPGSPSWLRLARLAKWGSKGPPRYPSRDLRLELRAARLCPGDGNHMTPIRAQVCHGCAPFGVSDHAMTAIPLFGSLSQSK